MSAVISHVVKASFCSIIMAVYPAIVNAQEVAFNFGATENRPPYTNEEIAAQDRSIEVFERAFQEFEAAARPLIEESTFTSNFKDLLLVPFEIVRRNRSNEYKNALVVYNDVLEGAPNNREYYLEAANFSWRTLTIPESFSFDTLIVYMDPVRRTINHSSAYAELRLFNMLTLYHELMRFAEFFIIINDDRDREAMVIEIMGNRISERTREILLEFETNAYVAELELMNLFLSNSVLSEARSNGSINPYELGLALRAHPEDFGRLRHVSHLAAHYFVQDMTPGWNIQPPLLVDAVEEIYGPTIEGNTLRSVSGEFFQR